MKKFLFLIFAAILCVGFTSCKPDDNSEEKQYTCYFKVVTQTAGFEDTLILASIAEENQQLNAAVAAALGTDDHREFAVKATDETSLKAKVEELCQKIVVDDESWYTEHIVNVYFQKDEKNSKEIYTNKYGGKIDHWAWPWEDDDWHTQVELTRYTWGPIIDGRTTWKFSNTDYPFESLCVSTSNSHNSKFMFLLDLDLNRNAGGKYVYILAHKPDWDSDDMITDLIVLNSGRALSSDFTFKYNNCTYKMVPWKDDSNGDLNQEANGAYLYLMYTKDKSIGRYLRNLCAYYGDNFTITEYEKVSESVENRIVPVIDMNGNRTKNHDLNQGAGGDYIYLVAKYGNWDWIN